MGQSPRASTSSRRRRCRRARVGRLAAGGGHQTTLSVDDAARSSPPSQRFLASASPRGDICYATQNRQTRSSLLSPKVDVVVVVGSPTSFRNSNRLRELPRWLGTDAHGRQPGGPARRVVRRRAASAHRGAVGAPTSRCSRSSPIARASARCRCALPGAAENGALPAADGVGRQVDGARLNDDRPRRRHQSRMAPFMPAQPLRRDTTMPSRPSAANAAQTPTMSAVQASFRRSMPMFRSAASVARYARTPPRTPARRDTRPSAAGSARCWSRASRPTRVDRHCGANTYHAMSAYAVAERPVSRNQRRARRLGDVIAGARQHTVPKRARSRPRARRPGTSAIEICQLKPTSANTCCEPRPSMPARLYWIAAPVAPGASAAAREEPQDDG